MRRALLFGCLLSVFLGRVACADEVWRFRKGEAERTVDVTELSEVVREAVILRMRADGYQRVEGAAPGQDLEADARELVAHGGRFRVSESPPAVQGVLLGASVRLERLGETGWLRILDAPDGSLAGALGLVRGDRITALDGRVPTPALLARLRTVELAPGQLALGVLRKEGRIEEWTLAFSNGPAPSVP